MDSGPRGCRLCKSIRVLGTLSSWGLFQSLSQTLRQYETLEVYDGEFRWVLNHGCLDRRSGPCDFRFYRSLEGLWDPGV